MENLVGLGQFWGGSFGFFGGLGLFFTGVGFLWFVTVYRDINKKEKYHNLAACSHLSLVKVSK